LKSGCRPIGTSERVEDHDDRRIASERPSKLTLLSLRARRLAPRRAQGRALADQIEPERGTETNGAGRQQQAGELQKDARSSRRSRRPGGLQARLADGDRIGV